MQWSDVSPYVAPYVIGCPYPVLEQHIKLAAMEFCRRTLCWQKTLDPVTTNGIDMLVEMEPDTGVQIIKVKAVAVDGLTHPLTDSVNGLALLRSGSAQAFCFTQDNKTLTVSPLQISGVQVIVDAALAPTLSAATLDDAVAMDYLQDIAIGAVASLLMLPKQDWTDQQSAQIYKIQFNARISTVAAKVARGFMAQKMRSHASYF